MTRSCQRPVTVSKRRPATVFGGVTAAMNAPRVKSARVTTEAWVPLMVVGNAISPGRMARALTTAEVVMVNGAM